jgi:hypothetical protein
VEVRRNTLRFARTFPPGSERNSHRQLATSLRILFRDKEMAAGSHAARFACSITHFVRNECWHAGLALMVRIGSRKWTPTQTAHLIALIDDGSSPASIAVSLKRSITSIRAKARNLGKPFTIVASRS